jgi:hypothetical protein
MGVPEVVLSGEDLAVIQDPRAEVIEMEVSSEIEEVPAEFEATAQTSAVEIFSVSCGAGASSRFRLPITAFYWHARLGYFRADGGRIGLSPIIEWPRSFYAGSVLSARWNGSLPRGLRDLRAFWWYGTEPSSGPTYWNRKSQRC